MITLLPLLFALWLPTHATEKGHLQIEITGLAKPTGKVYLAVYDKAEGFPTRNDKAFKRLVIPVKGLILKLQINDIELGKNIAISFYHDANDNGKMDTNLFGIPQERYGASNDARGMLGPPKFADALFVFNSDGQLLKMKAS